MKDYNSPKYDNQREWIAKARSVANYSWEEIYYGAGSTEDDLEQFLKRQSIDNFWEIDKEDWKILVRLEKEGEERRQNVSSAERSSIIGVGENVNDIGAIPTAKGSCWQKYRRHLLDDQHFLYDDVKSIEDSSFRILRRLNAQTEGEAIKGLVVGNVQSGKTANMAALMSMAADYGWNMFIVLSGTIENLRLQTLDRLLSDLNLSGCNLTWCGISHPSPSCTLEDKAQTLGFEPGNSNRYLTVCLKNSTRLTHLIKWLHEDRKSAEQMKILVIDDESDQAGVNTRSVDSEERTKINELIINLVGNNDADGDKLDYHFAAMNYIGYTATPYANVLNEAKEESLYPRDFISTLQVSKTYFGPQQIFGDRSSGNYSGLNIVRDIPVEEVALMKEIHKSGYQHSFPEKMKEAICWFLCCVAMKRRDGYRKPLSMLIHTSQITKHHANVNDMVKHWFSNENSYIVKECEKVWVSESEEFTKEDLFNDYPGFAVNAEDITSYPAFYEIKPYLEELLDVGLQNIKLGEEGKLNYNKGIHLCVDNCRNNGIKDDGAYIRLAYPNKGNSPDYATAFIVIGGSTLSRGLTIEGLVSTYFIRSTKQGDTLMQMGRWFGYRRGYELLQRIWITDNALHQFEFLSDMDSELRSCIAQMELFDKSPKDYAVVIKQSPAAKLLRISAKNKMQSAISTDMNYSGMHSQTQLFPEDETLLRDNFDIARQFIESLGQGQHGNGKLGSASLVWREIDFDSIYDRLLNKYHFHNKLIAFSNIEALRDWINSVTDDGKLKKWNVILFGIDKGSSDTFSSNANITKVTRTRKYIREGTINIGVLTDPKEKVADVCYDQLPLSAKKKYDNYKTDYADEIRYEGGLENTPSIVIYVIDKDSKKSGVNSKRYDLEAPCDLIGLSVNIPGDRINETYAKSVKIDLSKFGLGNDIEGEDDED